MIHWHPCTLHCVMSNVSLSYCALDAAYCNMWPMSTGQLSILLSLHCAQFLNVFTSFDYKSKQHHCGRWWKSRSSIREKCGTGGKGESVQAGLEKCWASVGWRRPVWPNIALLCATVCPRPVTGSVQHTLFYQRGSVAAWQCGSVAVWLCGSVDQAVWAAGEISRMEISGHRAG